MSRSRRNRRPAADVRPVSMAPPRPSRLSIREQLRSASLAQLALLPIRFFFGVTFIYAGLDKLLAPGFFDPNAAASIQSQFLLFERFSPLGPLVHLMEPLAVPFGL